MSSSSYDASIDLNNLNDEQQAAFGLYFGFLLPRKLKQHNRILTDDLFGSARRTVQRYCKLQRFPTPNAWRDFLQSQGAQTYFTARERSNLDRLYHGELPEIEEPKPEIIDPYVPLPDVFFERLPERWLLQEMLRDPDCRTIGISGRPGIGKTALLRRFLRDVTRGRWQTVLEMIHIDAVNIQRFIPREGLSAIDTLINATANLWELGSQKRLGLERRPTLQAKLDALWEAIAEQAGLYILVLDDAERMFDGDELDEGVQLFVEKLQDAPINFKLITLSRRDLTPHFPLRHVTISLEDGLSVDSAVSYLRLRDPNNAARLHDADEDDLRRIVQRMGSVPRALEYVVREFRQNKFLTVDDFVAPGSTERALANFVPDFFGHLEPTQLLVLQVAALLENQATVNAIAHTAQLSQRDAGVICSQLVDLGLVEGYDTATGKIQLHALDREYAYQLLEPESQRTLHRRAAAYFQQHAGDLQAIYSLNDLAEHVAAFEHLAKAKDYDEAGRWFYYGHADRMRQLELNASLLSISKWLSDMLTEPALLAASALFRAMPLFVTGNPEQCIEQLQAAEAHARHAHDTFWLVRILAVMAIIHSYQGRHNEALQTIAEAERLCNAYQGSDVNHLRARMLRRKSSVEMRAGNRAAAMQSAREAIHLTDDVEVVSAAQGNMATLHFFDGRYEAALDVYEELLVTAERHGLRAITATTLMNSGAACMELGRVDEAKARYERALAMTRGELRDKRLQGPILNNLIEIQGVLGQFEQADESFREAVAVAESVNLQTAQATALGEYGWVLIQRGDYNQAISVLRKGLRVGAPYENRVELARFGGYLACALMFQGDNATALTTLETLSDDDNPVHRAFVTLLTAMALLRLSQRDAAVAAVEDALSQAAQLIQSSPTLYRPYYIHALASATQATLIDTPAVHQAAEAAYTRAVTVTDVPGFQRQARLLRSLVEPPQHEV